MAHTKAGGKVRQQGNRPGKRLGLKVSHGQKVKNGMILIRQKGTLFHPGDGVKKSRDHSLYSLREGNVVFKKLAGKSIISVV
jgi:large subunit ribosomal protein L27